MKTSKTVGLVTFGVFMTEALIHYNMGSCKSNGEGFHFSLPPFKEFAKIGLVVGAFSLVNAYIIESLTKK